MWRVKILKEGLIMNGNGWVFWLIFALMMAISSYCNEGSIRECFDALICFAALVASRIEYILTKHKDT